MFFFLFCFAAGKNKFRSIKLGGISCNIIQENIVCRNSTAQDEIVVNICGEDVQRIMQRCVVINDFARALWHVSFLTFQEQNSRYLKKNKTDIYRPQLINPFFETLKVATYG